MFAMIRQPALVATMASPGRLLERAGVADQCAGEADQCGRGDLLRYSCIGVGWPV